MIEAEPPPPPSSRSLPLARPLLGPATTDIDLALGDESLPLDEAIEVPQPLQAERGSFVSCSRLEKEEEADCSGLHE